MDSPFYGLADSNISKYNAERSRLENLQHSLSIPVPALPAPDMHRIAETVALECLTKSNGINLNIKKSYSDSTAIVSGVVQSITDSLNSSIGSIFKLRDISDDLYSAYRQRLNELESALIAYPGAFRAELSPRLDVTTDSKFDVAAHIDISNIVPRKKKLFVNLSHTGEEIIQYISVVSEQLAPSHTPGQISDPGVLARTDVPRISESLMASVKLVTDAYNAALKSYYDSAVNSILKHILPDPDSAADKMRILTDLVADLKKLAI